MITIDEAYVAAAAPNAEAAKNGKALVLKGQFLKLHISEDGTLLFGECQGSGKLPYECSCDFARADAPTHRCSCPSRQFPCKHSLGLMFAYAQGKKFSTAAVPETLAAKRDKLSERKEKQAATADKPKTVNKSALAKKIQAQLEGMNVLEKLTQDLARLGIGNMNAKLAQQIEEQAKQLGNAYLPGGQIALHQYTQLFADDSGRFQESSPPIQRERIYSEALDQLGRLHTLVKQGRAYLQHRLDDADLKPETETSIAAWLGHAWQLRELKDAGLVESDAELVQLAFNSHNDSARQEYIDTGIWMSLGTGKISITQTFRPYKATKYIKSEDSFFQVAQVKELCVYPGGVNRRIRWEGMLPREIAAADFARIRSHTHADFAAIVKEVKTVMKGPLADKQPIYALQFQHIGRIGEVLIAADAKGERLVLTDAGMREEPASCHLLSLLPPNLLREQVIIARFRHDLDTRKLEIKPLSIVTASGITRLTL